MYTDKWTLKRLSTRMYDWVVATVLKLDDETRWSHAYSVRSQLKIWVLFSNELEYSTCCRPHICLQLNKTDRLCHCLPMFGVKIPVCIVLQYSPLTPVWRAGSAVELLTDDPGKVCSLERHIFWFRCNITFSLNVSMFLQKDLLVMWSTKVFYLSVVKVSE